MDNLYSSTNDTSYNEKNNNIQIVTTKTSDTEGKSYSDISDGVPIKQSSKSNMNNYLNSLQSDIVNIAESLHNLVSMVNNQTEKINVLEKEIARLSSVEKDHDKPNELKKVSNEDMPVINKRGVDTIAERKRNMVKKTVVTTKNCPDPDYDTSSYCNETMSCSEIPNIKNNCNREIEDKLNNITKEFNDELLNMKRKQAIIAATCVKKYHHSS